MKISDLFSLTNFHQLIDEGFINVNKHLEYPLSIANYSHTTQFAQKWTPETEQCRGLIYNTNTLEVVARPFPKFWNIEEHSYDDVLFAGSPLVFEKLDGSLGILYGYDDDYRIATRGSFNSDQAIKGTAMLKTSGYLPTIGQTDLFEIIFPTNRIVVDYGSLEALVYLCSVDIETGANRFDAEWPSLKAKTFEIADLHPRDLTTKLNLDNQEGFVIFFPHGNRRVKAKSAEYVRLHRIVTGVSTKSIWNSLRNGDSFEELLASIPDELYRWVEAVRDDLLAQYAGWMKKAYEQFARVVDEFFDGDIAKARVNRKDFALAVANIKQNGLLFKILDNKLINDDIWKMLEPEFKRPNYALGDEE